MVFRLTGDDTQIYLTKDTSPRSRLGCRLRRGCLASCRRRSTHRRRPMIRIRSRRSTRQRSSVSFSFSYRFDLSTLMEFPLPRRSEPLVRNLNPAAPYTQYFNRLTVWSLSFITIPISGLSSLTMAIVDHLHRYVNRVTYEHSPTILRERCCTNTNSGIRTTLQWINNIFPTAIGKSVMPCSIPVDAFRPK